MKWSWAAMLSTPMLCPSLEPLSPEDREREFEHAPFPEIPPVIPDDVPDQIRPGVPNPMTVQAPGIDPGGVSLVSKLNWTI